MAKKKQIGFTREENLEIARELFKQSKDERFSLANRDLMTKRLNEIAKKNKFTYKDIWG